MSLARRSRFSSYFCCVSSSHLFGNQVFFFYREAEVLVISMVQQEEILISDPGNRYMQYILMQQCPLQFTTTNLLYLKIL